MFFHRNMRNMPKKSLRVVFVYKNFDNSIFMDLINVNWDPLSLNHVHVLWNAITIRHHQAVINWLTFMVNTWNGLIKYFSLLQSSNWIQFKSVNCFLIKIVFFPGVITIVTQEKFSFLLLRGFMCTIEVSVKWWIGTITSHSTKTELWMKSNNVKIHSNGDIMNLNKYPVNCAFLGVLLDS